MEKIEKMGRRGRNGGHSVSINTHRSAPVGSVPELLRARGQRRLGFCLLECSVEMVEMRKVHE